MIITFIDKNTGEIREFPNVHYVKDSSGQILIAFTPFKSDTAKVEFLSSDNWKLESLGA